ncbi:hypothetical protein [Isoptericola aurantiacus]|uniref:hypothetical protein n=1 Tax=Isoptericola aurantiacus TaxID=3377839 RepID=UPI003839FF93
MRQGDNARADDDRPLLILDLDGAISPYGTQTRGGLQLARVGGYRMLYRPAVVEVLNDIHLDGVIDLRWLTSWGNDARTHVAPTLGLADFPLLDTLDRDRPPAVSPKLASIRRCVPEGRRFAWIDDDITATHRRELSNSYGPACLLLRPPVTTGLTVDDLDIARNFLTAQ